MLAGHGMGDRRACRVIGTRAPMALSLMPDQIWSLDFVSDQMTDGRRFRVITLADDCRRKCVALIADASLSGARVARELATLFEVRARPLTMVSDNVPAREGNAVSGVRSRGIRAKERLKNRYPGGFRRREVAFAIANTGSARLPPLPSLRRDPKSRAEGPNIVCEVRKLPPRLYREGSFLRRGLHLVPARYGDDCARQAGCSSQPARQALSS